MLSNIAGIKIGEFGFYFCDTQRNIIEKEDLQGFPEKTKILLHISEMTNSEKYKELINRRSALVKEFEIFVKEQERAGVFYVPSVGGTIDHEIYPPIII